MPNPLVSIITPVYNGAEYLDEMIQSVLQQDYPAIEHIVIDDGSRDNGATLAILQKYTQLRWWSRENMGQYATMNEGLMAAKGEFVCFISADDIVVPGAVSSVMDVLSRHPSWDGVFGITTRIDANGKRIPYYIPFQTAPLAFYSYFAHISHCSLYMKKSVLQERDLIFDPSLKYVGDYDWMIRIYKSGLRIGLLKQELSRVRLHDDQTSRKYASGSIMETQQVILKHRINGPAYVFYHTIYTIMVEIQAAFQAIKKDGIVGIVRRRIRKYQNK